MNARLPISISTAPWFSPEFRVFMWPSWLSRRSQVSEDSRYGPMTICPNRQGVKCLSSSWRQRVPGMSGRDPGLKSRCWRLVRKQFGMARGPRIFPWSLSARGRIDGQGGYRKLCAGGAPSARDLQERLRDMFGKCDVTSFLTPAEVVPAVHFQQCRPSRNQRPRLVELRERAERVSRPVDEERGHREVWKVGGAQDPGTAGRMQRIGLEQESSR